MGSWGGGLKLLVFRVQHISLCHCIISSGANEATPTSHKKPAVELHNAREVKFNPSSSSSSSMQSSYSRPIGQDETGYIVTNST